MSNLSHNQHIAIAKSLEKQAVVLRSQVSSKEMWMVEDAIAKRLRDATWHRQVAARKAGQPAIFSIDGIMV